MEKYAKLSPQPGCGESVHHAEILRKDQAALEALDEAAAAMREQVVAVNRAFEVAREENDEAAMAQLRETGRALTSRNLEAFRYAQKHLLGLM